MGRWDLQVVKLCADNVHASLRVNRSRYYSELTHSRRYGCERQRFLHICERPREYSEIRCRWTRSEDIADVRDIIFYHEVHRTADWQERVRNRFLGESNHTSAGTGLQGANFARTKSDKTRRVTTAPESDRRREQPVLSLYSEFVVSNPDAVQAYNTFDSACTGREHERDTDWPIKSIIILSGLQRTYVTRNSTIACVEIDIRTRKSGPSKPTSRPVLRNYGGTGTIDSTAGDVNTIPNCTTILLATTGIKTIDIITIPRICHKPRNIIILKFSQTELSLANKTSCRMQDITVSTSKHQQWPTSVHVESSDEENPTDLIIDFCNSSRAKSSGSSNLQIQLLELEL
ncbi:MAG: hypothetical protein EZS28_019006 [Streblomastix strix]|uniref:Uncharacterized protein n=1 Tax=Streblomastix strix TaxID=222440 RepID=A0A5J4VSS6_9EUKA|nr:MAG: hypothetical protein EZS28_019006 [Streblomastix strix]